MFPRTSGSSRAPGATDVAVAASSGPGGGAVSVRIRHDGGMVQVTAHASGRLEFDGLDERQLRRDLLFGEPWERSRAVEVLGAWESALRRSGRGWRGVLPRSFHAVVEGILAKEDERRRAARAAVGRVTPSAQRELERLVHEDVVTCLELAPTTEWSAAIGLVRGMSGPQPKAYWPDDRGRVEVHRSSVPRCRHVSRRYDGMTFMRGTLHRFDVDVTPDWLAGRQRFGTAAARAGTEPILVLDFDPADCHRVRGVRLDRDDDGELVVDRYEIVEESPELIVRLTG